MHAQLIPYALCIRTARATQVHACGLGTALCGMPRTILRACYLTQGCATDIWKYDTPSLLHTLGVMKLRSALKFADCQKSSYNNNMDMATVWYTASHQTYV